MFHVSAPRRPPAMLLLLLVITTGLAGCSPVEPSAPKLVIHARTRDPASLVNAEARLPTQTPFQPLRQTAIINPTQAPTATLMPLEAVAEGTSSEVQPALPAEAIAQDQLSEYSTEPTYQFYGIDFSSNQRVEIKIYPTDNRVNHGDPIKISFIPGERCRFGDKRGCVYAYKPSAAGNVIFITVHSGVGGEAQRWRAALEGTGINRAGYSLERTMGNMRSLADAQVVISQGDLQVDQLQLGAITRIPARALPKYFKTEMADILDFAARNDPEISNWAFTEQPIIVIETCGWKMPGEAGSERVADTTGSIYLAVIQ